MRATFALIGLILAAAAVSAQCPTAPANDFYAGAETCAPFAACRSTLCTQIGGTDSACRASSTLSCTSLSGAWTNFTDCLAAAGDAISTTTQCSAVYNAYHNAQLALAVGTYAGSDMQTSCQRAVCKYVNGTDLLTSCNIASTSYSAYCVAPLTTTTVPTPTSAAPATSFIVAALLAIAALLA